MKKRYLCPVCDQELTAKRYCPECRRIRKEPVVYEGWLLPNERDSEGILLRAAGEQAGSSGRAEGASASGEKAALGRQVQSGGRVYDSRYLDNCGSGHAHSYGVPNKDPHRAKRREKSESAGKSSRGLKAAVILVLVCITVAVLWERVWKLGQEIVSDIQEEYGVLDSGDSLPDMPDDEDSWAEFSGNGSADSVRVLADAEVLAAGEPCNGYSHYDVDGEEYVARLFDYLTDLWPEVPVEAGLWESSNEVYENAYSSYSYYRRQMRIYLDNGVSYTVICDTATGELMELNVGADAEEDFGPAFLLAACALEPERDRNEVWAEVEGLLAGMGEEEYYFGDWGISEVYLSGGTYCYGSMTCLPEYDKYGD